MSKNLLIVESPAKAKTIEKYLGKDFKVKSSVGHIRDLAKGDQGINIEKDFEPTYVILCEVLGLDVNTTKRIVFREITKSAITKAVEDPRLVDIDLVNAQQARRILDRLVGFELSGVLWRKVRGKLSAGRVQSVTVKLIVFNVKNSAGKMVELKADYASRFDDMSGARAFLEDCRTAEFKIADIIKKPTKKKPAAPFTTSTLQQDASRKLGFSVNRTMQNAQRLYEAGHISYMRTDSTALSSQAMGQIGEQIKKEFGAEYHKERVRCQCQSSYSRCRPTKSLRSDQKANDSVADDRCRNRKNNGQNWNLHKTRRFLGCQR